MRKTLRNWVSAGASSEVLKWVKRGVRTEWKEGKRLVPFHQGRPSAGVGPEERESVLSEVDRLLDWRSALSPKRKMLSRNCPDRSRTIDRRMAMARNEGRHDMDVLCCR